VVGDSKHEEFGNIQKLHNYHALRWVLVERPPQTQRFLNKRNDGSELSYLALELENKPGSIDTWRKFVRNLGPLGCNNNGGEVHPDHASTCPQCQWLREGRVMDHHYTGSWWGANRAWWVDNVLQMKSLIQRRWKKFTEPVMQRLEQHMTKLAPSCTSHFNNISTWKEIRKQDLTTEWLPTDDGNNHDADDQERTAEERSTTYGSELPKRLLLTDGLDEAGGLDDDDEDPFQSPNFQGPFAKRLEVACYKILIFGHLSSEMGQAEVYLHGLIEKCILGTATNVMGVNQECDEFRALQWLCYMGLDIPKMARANYYKYTGNQAAVYSLQAMGLVPAAANDGSSSSGADGATTTMTAVAL
jgi:hypothetical protein